MIKLTAVLLVVCHLSLQSMEGNDEFKPSEWPKMRLRTLLEQAESSTCSRYNEAIRVAKLAFVQYWLKKYEDQRGILNDLNEETRGVVRCTADPELAKMDANKFLFIVPLECTAEEIDARWQRIHHADCKYKGPRKIIGQTELQAN